MAYLFLEAQAQQLLLLSLNLAGLLGRRNGSQQALDSIQGTVSIIGTEGLLVRPSVTRLTQLAHQCAFTMTQHILEDLVPLIPQNQQ